MEWEVRSIRLGLGNTQMKAERRIEQTQLQEDEKGPAEQYTANTPEVVGIALDAIICDTPLCCCSSLRLFFLLGQRWESVCFSFFHHILFNTCGIQAGSPLTSQWVFKRLDSNNNKWMLQALTILIDESRLRESHLGPLCGIPRCRGPLCAILNEIEFGEFCPLARRRRSTHDQRVADVIEGGCC